MEKNWRIKLMNRLERQKQEHRRLQIEKLSKKRTPKKIQLNSYDVMKILKNRKILERVSETTERPKELMIKASIKRPGSLVGTNEVKQAINTFLENEKKRNRGRSKNNRRTLSNGKTQCSPESK